MKILVIALIASTAFGAQPEHSIEQLRPCRAARASLPRGWRTIEGVGGRGRFSIPGNMREVHDPAVFCVHGCEEWARGTFKISVSHGLWDASSFTDEDWATACVDKRGSLRVVQMPDTNGSGHRVIVWPVNDSVTQSTEDVILTVQWSKPADEADAAKVIASVR